MRNLAYLLCPFMLAFMLLMPVSSHASPDPEDVDVTVSIPVYFDLWVTRDGSPCSELNWNVSIPQLQGGLSSQKGVTVHVCANTPWKVLIRGSGGEWFTFETDSGYIQSNKEVGDIEWQDGAIGYQALTTSNVTCQDYLDDPENIVWVPGDPDWTFDLSFQIQLSIEDWAGVHHYDSITLTLAEY